MCVCVCFVVCGFVYVCVVQRDTHFLQLVCGVLCRSHAMPVRTCSDADAWNRALPSNTHEDIKWYPTRPECVCTSNMQPRQ